MDSTASSPAAQALVRGRRQLVEEILPARRGQGLTGLLSGLVDGYFRDRLAEVWPGGAGALDTVPFTLAAVGGYGRSELCLRSDVDILILCRRRIPAQALDLAQSLFFPLWDMGLDLGHGFRTIKDCLNLARDDFQVLASLLDARHVAGNKEIFGEFAGRAADKVFAKRRAAFTDWLDRKAEERRVRFGDASALLEPDLKEGIGGLRDYHQVLWLGRLHHGAGDVHGLLRAGALTEAEAGVLADQADFLCRARNFLHHHSGRHNDRLLFQHQVQVAADMGYEDTGDGGPDSLPVERFLTRLHREMAGLKAILGSFREGLRAASRRPSRPEPLAPGVVRDGDQVRFDFPKAFPDPPLALLDIFVQAAGRGLPVAWSARRLASGHLHMVKQRLRGSPEAAALFMGLLGSGRAADALEQMMETGVLGAYLPEFGRVQDVVQFDTYHIYPVGPHSLHCVRALESLPRDGGPGEGRLPELWEDLEESSVLVLAALLHDVGKGLGGGHAQKGAAMALEVAGRLGLEPDRAADVEFLVREHLFMAETATRRDLGDESVVAGAAGRIATPERLRMLYLLTWADAKATGPGVWTPWMASLLSELFHKVENIFRGRTLATPHAVQKILRTRDALRRGRWEDLTTDEVEAFLERMPARYFLTLEPGDIAEHMRMVRGLHRAVEQDRRRRPGGKGGQGVVVVRARHRPESDCWDMALAALDAPGLFKTVTGVLALQDVNILSAECFVWRDAVVVDIFTVSDLPGHLEPDELWQRVELWVRSALSGRLDLDYRLSQKRESMLAPRSLPHPARVEASNTGSDFYTVVEISASDRVGLLHDVAHVFLEHGVSLRLARIATFGDRVADAFYVRDAHGQKVEDPDLLEAVRQGLLAVLRPGGD